MSQQQPRPTAPQQPALPALPTPNHPHELEAVLIQMTEPNTARIKQAENCLKEFLKQPASVQAMVQQIQQSTRVAARQMAAVLLRNRIGSLWPKLAPELCNQIKAFLMQKLVNEPHQLVRTSVAALISSVAQMEVPDGKWPNLLQFLLECSRSHDPSHREVAMMLFRALAENISESLKPHFSTLQAIFTQGLKDSQESIRLEALKAVGVLVEYLDDDEQQLRKFREMIPPLITVVQAAISERREDAAVTAFQVFDSLATSSVPVFQQHIPQLVKLMLEVVSARALDINIREKGSLFLNSLISSKPGQITKHTLLDPILAVCVSLVAEPFEDLFEAQQMTPQKAAVEILDALSMHLPKRLIVPPLLSRAATMVRADNAHVRKGGFVILAVMAEGCGDQLRPQLEPLLAAICAGIKDPDALVRTAACVALTQFADHIQPEIAQHHKLVLPHAFLLLDSAAETVMVKKKCCVVLEVFCEKLGEEIKEYIQPILQRVVPLIQHADPELKSQAMSAIRSTALAARTHFAPFAAPTMGLVMQAMTQTTDEMLRMRCAATECAGAVAIALGPEAFQPYLKSTLDLAVKGMALEFFELREAAHNYFSSLASSFGNKLTPLLPFIMPPILGSCFSDDGMVLTASRDDDGGLNSGPSVDFSDPDEDDECEEGEGGNDVVRGASFSIRTGALDEKVAALTALAECAHAVGKDFLPYLAKSLEALNELCEYMHNFVRTSVVQGWHAVFSVLFDAYPCEKWQPGVAVALHPEVVRITGEIVPLLIDRLKEEEDKETCATACETVTELLQRFGMGPVQAHLKPLSEALFDLLSEKAPCQVNEEDLDESEVADHDEVLIDSVTDAIEALCETIGGRFEPIFKQFIPPLLKFCSDKRPESDRHMAIGTFGECVRFLGEPVLAHTPRLMQVISQGLKDPADPVRRNAAFLCGELMNLAGERAVRFHEQMVKALEPMFSVPDDTKDGSERWPGRDNACSALSKIFKASKGTSINAYTVSLFVKGLPIVSDMTEASNVYMCLVSLFQHQPQLMLPHLPAIVNAIPSAVGVPDVETPVQQALIALVRSLLDQQGAVMRSIIEAMPAPRREHLMKALA